ALRGHLQIAQSAGVETAEHESVRSRLEVDLHGAGPHDASDLRVARAQIDDAIVRATHVVIAFDGDLHVGSEEPVSAHGRVLELAGGPERDGVGAERARCCGRAGRRHQDGDYHRCAKHGASILDLVAPAGNPGLTDVSTCVYTLSME